MQTKRLTTGDRDLARMLFAMIAEVFDEDADTLSDAYIDNLLAREDFWAIGAFVDNQIIGGVTAHVLPMTRAVSCEVFIYDIAVRRDHQRMGIGRHLVTELRESVATSGIGEVFVLSENKDSHALDFYRAIGGTPSPVTLFSFRERNS